MGRMSRWNLEQGARATEAVPRRQRVAGRRLWNWFGGLFGLVVLVGASVLYIAGRAPTAEGTPTAQSQGASAGEALQNHNRLQEPVPADDAVEPSAVLDEAAFSDASGRALGALVGVFVVDSFGFHDMEETYGEATEVNERDAGRVAKIILAVDSVDWPDQLGEAVAAFRADVVEVYQAIQASDLNGVRHGLEGVHATQHDLSNAVYGWLSETRGTDLPQAHTPAGGSDSPDPATTATDTTVSSEGTTTQTTVSSDDEMQVIEVEMFEFGYTPNALDIPVGEAVTLRFTNRGKLPHEAMVGDAHMQEEFAAAGDHDDGEGGDDHHGDLMATLVQPGETQDLEVVIDEPGTWYVACHLVGHYEAGQVATINVGA